MSRDLLEAMMGMRAAMGGGDDDKSPPATPEELTELGKRYLEKHEFKPGDLVTWKKGMCNCKYPKDGSAGVVMEVMPGNRREDSEVSNHKNEPLEVRVGVFIESCLQGFWLDGNRLEPYRESETA